MEVPKSELDIGRSIKTIEWLKAELLAGVSSLFRGMVSNSEEAIVDSLANIVLATYILGRRLGVPYSKLDGKIINKIKANMDSGHEIEEWYGDFSALLNQFQSDAVDRRRRDR